MSPSCQIQPDGSFDVITPSLRLEGLYPEFDGRSIRPLAVEVRAVTVSEIIYHLAQGDLRLRFKQDADRLVLSSTLTGIAKAPWKIAPCVGGLAGAAKVFVQGLGFSGPSGFVPVSSATAGKFWSLESYLMTAAVASDGSSMAIYATDHNHFLQKTTIANRQSRRGLIHRHVASETVHASVEFATEGIAIDSAVLHLPDIHFSIAVNPWRALKSAAGDIAREMKCRVRQPPRYHWCSWYERGPNFTAEDLQATLAGLATIKPPIPLQAIQIDAGYCPSLGDWLLPRDIWPGGLEAAFGVIRAAGYQPGIWVGPFMVGCRSQLFREHPDWIIRTTDGKPYREWTRYDSSGIPGHIDEEFYALDASHPQAREYLRHVFRTLRQWGARFFKTDFLDWGLKDGPQFVRHNADETSVQSFRKVLQIIREEIGQESHWLGCIAPYSPCLGFTDSMRVANDVGHTWAEPSHGNMIQETYASQYFNHTFWQNDPDVIFLRDYHTDLTATEVRTLALWQSFLDTSVNTSDRLDKLPPDRLALWRFIRPGATPVDVDIAFFGLDRKLRWAVRRYENADAWAVLTINPMQEAVTELATLNELIGLEEAYIFVWGPSVVEPLGRMSKLAPSLGAHGSVLYFLSRGNQPPSPQTDLGGNNIARPA